MPYFVQVLLVEGNGIESGKVNKGVVHAEGQYGFNSLEMAREAAQVACNAAASMRPARSRTTSDETWTEHPDRSDAADV